MKNLQFHLWIEQGLPLSRFVFPTSGQYIVGLRFLDQ